MPREQSGAGKENGIAEIEALRPEDGRMARHKHEHVARLYRAIASCEWNGCFKKAPR
jgi:hypothetical protein